MTVSTGPIMGMIEDCAEWGNLGRIADSVAVRGRRVWIERAWDMGLEDILALSPHEFAGRALPVGERSVIADFHWSYNDGYLKAVIWDDGKVAGSVHLPTVTKAAVIADWAALFGWPYNGELDEVAA